MLLAHLLMVPSNSDLDISALFSVRDLEVGFYTPPPTAESAYFASKAGMTPCDIRVNVIAPGVYPSELTEGLITQAGIDGVASVDGKWRRDFILATGADRAMDIVGVAL